MTTTLTGESGYQVPAHSFGKKASSTSHAGILKSTNLLAKFEEFLSFGTRPFFLEGRENHGTKVLQTIQKTRESDIPAWSLRSSPTTST